MKKRYCGHCGYDVTKEKEDEYGIVCPQCHNDFWASECLPEGYHKKGLYTLNELRATNRG